MYNDKVLLNRMLFALFYFSFMKQPWGISQEGIAGTQWIVLQSVENLCPEKPGNKAAVEWEAAEYAGNAGKAQ